MTARLRPTSTRTVPADDGGEPLPYSLAQAEPVAAARSYARRLRPPGPGATTPPPTVSPIGGDSPTARGMAGRRRLRRRSEPAPPAAGGGGRVCRDAAGSAQSPGRRRGPGDRPAGARRFARRRLGEAAVAADDLPPVPAGAARRACRRLARRRWTVGGSVRGVGPGGPPASAAGATRRPPAGGTGACQRPVGPDDVCIRVNRVGFHAIPKSVTAVSPARTCGRCP